MPERLPAVVATALRAGPRHLVRTGGRVLVLLVVVVVVVLVVRALVRRARARRPAAAGLVDVPLGSGAAPSAKVTAVAAWHLTRSYGTGATAVRALDDVTVQIPEGAMVCIMGRSGSGKSTLLRLLGLIDVPTGGRVLLHGQDVTALDEGRRGRLRLTGLGYVFQEYALLPELTAAENVYLPAMMAGTSTRDYRARADELLGLVGLAGRTGHRPAELSGGEQQRVAIARALANSPGIVFADEPTANLDTESARTVMEALRHLNRTLGITVVFVSHDPDDARYATALVHLSDGRVVDGSGVGVDDGARR